MLWLRKGAGCGPELSSRASVRLPERKVEKYIPYLVPFFLAFSPHACGFWEVDNVYPRIRKVLKLRA